MIEQARQFAVTAHGNQRYGDRPYSFHLDAVAELATAYGDDARIVAYLHDTVEDTAIELTEIETRFGERIARCVAILTDAPGADRRERKARTYHKMSQVDGDELLALIVKAADRLANIKACIDDDRQDKLAMYRNEHPAFRQAAYRPGLCDALWAAMDRALES